MHLLSCQLVSLRIMQSHVRLYDYVQCHPLIIVDCSSANKVLPLRDIKPNASLGPSAADEYLLNPPRRLPTIYLHRSTCPPS